MKRYRLLTRAQHNGRIHEAGEVIHLEDDVPPPHRAVSIHGKLEDEPLAVLLEDDEEVVVPPQDTRDMLRVPDGDEEPTPLSSLPPQPAPPSTLDHGILTQPPSTVTPVAPFQPVTVAVPVPQPVMVPDEPIAPLEP